MYFDRYDILSAYWLFGSLYHSGQGSKEYSYMGRAEQCGFKPGPLFSEHSLTENGREIYNALVEKHYGYLHDRYKPSPSDDLPADYEVCGTCGYDHAYDINNKLVAARIVEAHKDDNP